MHTMSHSMADGNDEIKGSQIKATNGMRHKRQVPAMQSACKWETVNVGWTNIPLAYQTGPKYFGLVDQRVDRSIRE